MISNRKALIVGLKSYKLSNNEKIFLKKHKPWGVILFSRNIKSINQTKTLTDNIKKIFKDKNYPILIDQEGGRVNRLNKIISFDNLTSEIFPRNFIQLNIKNLCQVQFLHRISMRLKTFSKKISM